MPKTSRCRVGGVNGIFWNYKEIVSMNKIICFAIMLMYVGCKATKETSPRGEKENFAYVLPLPVEEEVWRLIKAKNLENSNLFFQLRRANDSYHLLITPTKDITNEYLGFFRILNSNRSILINDKFYPIVFDSDYDFGSLVDKIESLDKRKQRYMSNEYTIKRGPYVVNELSFGIKFSKYGELLK